MTKILKRAPFVIQPNANALCKAGKAQAEQAQNQPREALVILEEQFSSGARPHDLEDGTRSSRVKKTAPPLTAVTEVLRSVSTQKWTQSREQHTVVDLDARV